MAEHQELIDAPHGQQEIVKMDLLGLIHEGTDPFEIIYEMAKYLEAVSAERGYAQHIIDNIHTIYGQGLGKAKPLQDEIEDLKNRHERIKSYLASTRKDDTVSEEERARLNFALKAHERKIEKLQVIIDKQIEFSAQK